MSRYYQVPHHAMGWLLLAALWALVPVLLRGPLVMLVVVLLLIGWRWQVARMRFAMPGRLLRIALLLLLVLLTFWHYHTIFGPDAGVALLASILALKMLEMFRLRDAYVVLLLGYFLLAMEFLFQQGPLITLYVLAGFLLYTAALIGINQADDKGRALQHLKLASVLLAQAVPLMLVIFVLVPRVAPLWGFSLNNDQAKTGLSDSMEPGDISDISQSSDPVFRVEFQGNIPPPDQRYWRGLTYSWFDGERWSQAMARGLTAPEIIHYTGESDPPWLTTLNQERKGRAPDYRYRVLMEPSGRRWLFTLDVPFSETADVGLARDFRLVSRDPVNQAMAYRVESYSHLTMDATLPAWLRDLNLSLPATGNPQTRAWAQQLRASSQSDQDYITRLLAWFHDQPFYYTLHPPKMTGPDGIDAFLFRERRGFCAHYASAFTFMMRAVGIPARVVAGYQGGEVNPLGHYLQVRQYDAHAWVEVWLPGQGWVREDPTAAVAPARVEDGLFAALRDEGETAGVSALAQWQNGGLLARIGMMGDYMNYLWQRWVLNYDQSSQQALFKQWFSWATLLRVLLGAALLLFALALAVYAWSRWQLRRAVSPWQWQYQRLCRALVRRGLAVQDGQSPRKLIGRACELWPEKKTALQMWLETYHALAYGTCTEAEHAALITQLKRQFPF